MTHVHSHIHTLFHTHTHITTYTYLPPSPLLFISPHKLSLSLSLSLSFIQRLFDTEEGSSLPSSRDVEKERGERWGGRAEEERGEQGKESESIISEERKKSVFTLFSFPFFLSLSLSHSLFLTHSLSVGR